jgi:hypothetical protein
VNLNDDAAWFAPEELLRQFQPDPQADTQEGEHHVELPTIPASSPAMRQLDAELRASANELAQDSPLRDLLLRVARGETDLQSAVKDSALPTLEDGLLAKSTLSLIEQMRDGGESG